MVFIRINVLSCLLLSSAFLLTESAIAQGEHSRRAAVEIQILLGDFRRLDQEELTDAQVLGLNDRISGSLSVLEILLRFADDEQRRSPVDHRAAVMKMRSQWNDRNVNVLMQRLEILSADYPLQIVVPDTHLTAAQFSNSAHLHSQLCSACHDHAPANSERPAYNLFEEASLLTETEFIARMFNGVRGDAYTGIDNPLSDIQILQLYRYYLQADPVSSKTKTNNKP